MTLDELKDKYGQEKVLCVDNRHLESWNRVETNELEALDKAVSTHGYYDYRYNAEINYSAKQLIPYVVLKQGNQLYVTERLKGDSRLVGSSSIAVGGHVDVVDNNNQLSNIVLSEVVHNCIKRELAEELNGLENIDLGDCTKYFKCTFIDESTDVSKVHVCLLVVIEVEQSVEVSIKETDKLVGGWQDIASINTESLENWSRIALKILIDEEPVEQPVILADGIPDDEIVEIGIDEPVEEPTEQPVEEVEEPVKEPKVTKKNSTQNAKKGKGKK